MNERTEKRFYKVGEKVFVKPLQRLGVVKELIINIETKTYKAVVETTQKMGEATVVTTKTYDLWDLDKNKREMYKDNHKRTLVVPVKYFDNEVEQLQEIEIGDWIDLRSRIDVDIPRFESFKIPLNVAMRLPNGYEAHVKPRSSTYDKWGVILANSVGVIDNSYQGNDDEWLFNAVAIKGNASIKKGDRIAQFKIVPKMDKKQFKFKTVEKLLGDNRGGFGTTGSN